MDADSHGQHGEEPEWTSSPAWGARVEQLGLEFLAAFFAVDVQRHPDHLASLVELGHVYTQLGRYQEGLEIDQRLAEALPDDPTVHYNLACSLALLGRGQEALAALEWALGCGYEDVEFLLGDDDLASIREEPRFQALVRELLDRQQSD